MRRHKSIRLAFDANMLLKCKLFVVRFIEKWLKPVTYAHRHLCLFGMLALQRNSPRHDCHMPSIIPISRGFTMALNAARGRSHPPRRSPQSLRWLRPIANPNIVNKRLMRRPLFPAVFPRSFYTALMRVRYRSVVDDG
jgi:hypothetical protein